MAGDINTLNRVRFSGAEFSTHLDDLRARLQIKFAADFNDFALSSMGIMLLDLVAFGLDTLSFYLDRRATDNFMTTARTRKSVSRLSRQLGYKIRGAISSSVDLTVSLTTAQAFNVTIPIRTKFTTSDGKIFESAEAVTFPAGSGINDTKSIPCYEGQTLSETFVSDGQPNQVFELRKIGEGSSVASGSVQVIVNGSSFVEVDFLEYDTTDQFEVGYGDQPPTVKFGDGIAGNIPTTNATIKVTYVATSGKSGLVAKDTITKLQTPLTVAGILIPLTINNSESSIGGDDSESLDSVRSFAGKVFKARNVAVTEADYFALAGSYADPLFGRVAVAKAIPTRGASGDVELNNHILNIQTLVSAPVDDVTTLVDGATVKLDAIDDEITSITNELTDINSLSTTVASNLQTLLVNGRSSKNILQESLVNAEEATDALSATTTGAIDIFNAIPIGASDLITSATRDSILTLLSASVTDLNEITTNLNGVVSTLTSDISTMSDTVDAVNLLDQNYSDVATATTNISTQVGEDDTEGLRKDLVDIQAVVVDVDADVNTELDAISAHVDAILAADCKANLVTVPILSFDATGFYKAPSNGLIKSLQGFLDARKEVTQVVKVTSGVQFLIPVVLTIRIAVFTGFSESIIAASAQAVVDSILKGRAFGQSLYVSELTCAIQDIIGVDFDNVTIVGHLSGSNTITTKLDANGNLIINNNEIITKGTVTIETEVSE